MERIYKIFFPFFQNHLVFFVFMQWQRVRKSKSIVNPNIRARVVVVFAAFPGAPGLGLLRRWRRWGACCCGLRWLCARYVQSRRWFEADLATDLRNQEIPRWRYRYWKLSWWRRLRRRRFPWCLLPWFKELIPKELVLSLSLSLSFVVHMGFEETLPAMSTILPFSVHRQSRFSSL